MTPALTKPQQYLLARLPADGSEIRTDSLTHATALAKRGLIAWRFTEARHAGRLTLRYFAKITAAGLAFRSADIGQ